MTRHLDLELSASDLKHDSVAEKQAEGDFSSKSHTLLSRIIGLAFCLVCTAALYAEDSATIIRVEEDWELVVIDPDPDSSGPQINCLISPIGNANGTYATLELNHHSLNSDEEGGMQLQVWDGESRVGPAKIVTAATLSTLWETITWTQSMRVSGTGLVFEVINGSSETWTKFGTDTTSTTDTTLKTDYTSTDYALTDTTLADSSTNTLDGAKTYVVEDDALLIDGSIDTRILTSDDPLYSAVSSSLTNLNAYNPQVSVDESGVAYGANLVQSLKLVRVRKYMSDGTIQTDSTSRVVYENSN